MRENIQCIKRVDLKARKKQKIQQNQKTEQKHLDQYQNEVNEVKQNKPKQNEPNQNELKQEEMKQVPEQYNINLKQKEPNQNEDKIKQNPDLCFHYCGYSTNDIVVIDILEQFFSEKFEETSVDSVVDIPVSVPVLSTLFLNEFFESDQNMLKFLQFLVKNDSIELTKLFEISEEKIAEIIEIQTKLFINIIQNNVNLVHTKLKHDESDNFMLVDFICSKMEINVRYLRIVLSYVKSLKGTVCSLLGYDNVGETQIAALRLLLQKKDSNGKMMVDLNECDSEGKNSVWQLLKASTLSPTHISCIEELIKAGVDPNAFDSSNAQTLVHTLLGLHYFDSSHVNCLNMLLPCYVDINAADKNFGNVKNAGTVLHHVALAVHSESFNKDRFAAFKLLISKGADVNFLDHRHRETPLMTFCKHCTDLALPYVEFLLQQRTINVDLVDASGRSALEIIFRRKLPRGEDAESSVCKSVVNIAQLLLKCHIQDDPEKYIARIEMCFRVCTNSQLQSVLVQCLVDLYLTDNGRATLLKAVTELPKPLLAEFYTGVQNRLQIRKFSQSEPFAKIVTEYL